MKRFSLVVAITAVTAVSLASSTPTAATLMADAQKKAAKENKKIFVKFRASWCGWCKRMDEFMNRPEFKNIFLDNYVIVALTVMESKDKKDLENLGADKLMADWGGAQAGLPFTVILDKNGKKLADSMAMLPGADKPQNIGHPAKKEEIEHFMKMLKSTAPRMTQAQFKQIEQALIDQRLG